MTDQEFAEILALAYERRGIEFKGAGPLNDKSLRAKVVRAVLGMANRRDGGFVVVGVEDTGGKLDPVGLDATDISTWKYDDVADAIAAYADPSISFDLETRSHEGKQFVVLHVYEFDDVPVLCKKDFADTLRKGACYVRSRRKPETSEIPTQEDMRDLLDLATEKRLRRFAAQAQAAGLVAPSSPAPSDQDRFEEQIRKFL